MNRPRFSIASILIVVLFVAVGIAALREATAAWDGGIFGVTILALLTAVLLAAYNPSDRRPYWLGFSLFGWAYLVASLIPSVADRLPTTKGLVYLDSRMPGRSVDASIRRSGNVTRTKAANSIQSVAFTPDGTRLVGGQPGNVRLWKFAWAGLNGTTDNFVRIGHSLLALLSAFAGGHLARHLASGRGSEPRV